MRYKFYREHKYVSAAFNDLERLVAKTDFCTLVQVEEVQQNLDALVEMLKGHVHYEETVLHELLRKKHSTVYEKIEAEHHHLDETLACLQSMLKELLQGNISEEQQLERGYQFYLLYRKFVGDNLLHLHKEETIILPELQRLYTDKELKAVEPAVYRIMSTDDLASMINTLFPHMNSSDRDAFLTDIKDCEPEKFAIVWQAIQTILDPSEQAAFIQKNSINFNNAIVKKSSIGQFADGLGAFASRDFKKGDIVIKWNLKKLTLEEYKKLSEYEQNNFCHTRNDVIHFYPDPERHVNRSKDPNVLSDMANEANVALRDIKCGEELSIADSTKEDF